MRDKEDDQTALPVAARLARRLYQQGAHPWRAVLELAHFRLLTALSHRLSPLGTRLKDRLRKSAAKRDPARYLVLAETLAEERSGGTGPRGAGRSEDFLPYDPPPPFTPDVRVVAHYLPQFHPFAENDAWWGKGFTEWTNVGKAQPLFAGHHQPHCPIHLGYYDLRLPEVMEEQARIARAYGIGGFAYYFYWFAGRTLMEAPLRAMLANPAVEMPFALTWANENWTRRWDGKDEDILIGQAHSLEDSRALIRHLADYFRDPRYIRVEGKPVFTVYRPEIIPDIRATTDLWRAEAKAMGFEGLHLLATETSGRRDPRAMGFDAGVEFPPIGFAAPIDRVGLDLANPEFAGRIHDYRQVVAEALAQPPASYPRYRSAMLSWDNSARKPQRADIFDHFSIADYRRWLSALCRAARAEAEPDRRMVFVNAWNEWAEGTHLEPDQRYGFAYLNATYEALTDKR